MIKVEEYALLEFLDTLIVCKAEIAEKLKKNRAINRLNVRKTEKFNKATRCYIWRNEFVEGEAQGFNVLDQDHITGTFIGVSHRQCYLERFYPLKIPVFCYNFRGYNAHIFVHDFGKRPYRRIKIIDQNI